MEKVFLFDVGNVLMYPFDFEEFYNTLNIEEDFDEFKEFFIRTCNLAESGKMSDYDFFDGIIKRYNLNISIDELRQIYLNSDGDFNPEALELLRKIKSKGYKIYILSDLKETDFSDFKEHVSEDLYDKFYKSYEIGYTKPSREIYEYVINDLGINPSNIIFFDDKEKNVNGAREVGIDARLVNSFNLIEYFNNNDFI